MASTTVQPIQGSGNGLVQIHTPEELIQKKLAEERARLTQELGVVEKQIRHFERPKERFFSKAERPDTTLLFGGLTWKHEKLIHGAFESLGYKTEAIPTPDVAAFQLGKEFGNNGQCNPTYFTVGNLVQYLQNLEAKGLARDEILNNYVFLTAGACGPCRFGMYEAEYRLALRNSGFDGFRVILFQQSGGLNQAEAEAGLEMNLDFFLGILNAMNMGDVLSELAHMIVPYEANAGETDRVLAESFDYLHDVMRSRKPARISDRVEKIAAKLNVLGKAEYVAKFLDQLFGDGYTDPVKRVFERFGKIEVDRFRIRPIVKVTGEFWAQTTEGDGNFNMFRFLEREGAEVLVEPVGTWIMYMIHQAKQKVHDRKGLEDGAMLPSWWHLGKRLSTEIQSKKKEATLSLAEKIFKREYEKLVEALGGIPHRLSDQYELQRIGHPFYNSRAGGGEGHLEVAKNIYYTNKSLAHMVLSVKPFGCMPSTQSDGAQSAVVNLYKDMIYLPVETSGEGEINAHSRVQMALGEAKVKAKNEFKTAVESTGVSLDDLRRYVDDHPELKSATHKLPHYDGIIGTAPRFAKHVAERMKGEPARVVVN